MKQKGSIEGALRALYEGAMTFEEFERATREDWRRMARHLASHWPRPAWHSDEDVVQDLLVGVWEHLWDYDPSRGPSISEFVLYNACCDATVEIHRARGASLGGNRGRNATRIPRPFSAFGRSDDKDALAAVLAEFAAPAEAEVMVERQEHALSACETVKERIVVEALLRVGGIERATQLVYGDRLARATLGLVDEHHALREVASAAVAVAYRAEAREQMAS
jgi:DNA-directed RNA polymerase specialized sigma24 family protein